MNIAIWTLIFSFFGLLASCQVKETVGGSGLISGHASVTNAFTLNSPASGTLVTGDTLTLTLTFPYDVTVNTTGGTPDLSVTIGANTRSAVYTSGTGTKTLTFTYTIVAADDDTDGITVAAINLKSGTLTFSNNGTITNCSTTFTARTFSSVLVDNTAPVVSDGIFMNLPSYYIDGDSIGIQLTFSEEVYITGNPRLRMVIDKTTAGLNQPVYANYTSGSGTTTLNFSYTITDDAREVTTPIAFDATIDLNSGTMEDSNGNTASINLGTVETDLETLSSAIKFNGRIPVLQNITVPTPTTYSAAQTLEFVLEFDRAVSVTAGTELSLPIMLGTNGSASTRKAYYNSGASNSTSLVFQYTIVPGDSDSDGIQTATQLTMTGASIKTLGSADATDIFVSSVTIGATTYNNHDLNMPVVSGIKVSATQPAIQSVSIAPDTSGAWGSGTTSDNYFKIGEGMLITLNFNDTMYVGQTGGTPRIPVTVGAATKYATYLSGGDGQTSLIFKYIVEVGDEDTNGIDLAANLDLHGGTITNAVNTNTLLTIPTTSFTTRLVDGVRPSISTITSPASGTYSAVTSPQMSQLDFVVNWNEVVKVTNTVNLPIYINTNLRNTTYLSGSTSANTTFRYTIVSGDITDADGITMVSPMAITSGSIYDAHGNTPATPISYTLPDSSGVLVDRTPPTASLTLANTPPVGRYTTTTDQYLDFDMDFSENVTIDTTGGEPYITLTIGSNTSAKAYASAGTGTTHRFRYTVTASDTDADFVSFTSTTITIPASSSIKDSGLNSLSPLTFVDPGWTGVVIDEIVPDVSSASTTAGTYVASGDGTSTITLSLTMSEAVDVDTGGGTPYIVLALPTGNVNAEYDPGTSTATVLKFNYAIDGATDMDLDGLEIVGTDIELNGGTIEDLRDNEATLTIGTVNNLDSAFVVPHATVWLKGTTASNKSGMTGKPTISSVPASNSGAYWTFDGITDTIAFSGLGTVYAAYMALRTPDALATYPQVLVKGGASDEVTLDNANIDMATVNTPDINCINPNPLLNYISTGTDTHNSAFFADNLYECEFLFSGGVSLSASPFVTNTFSGSVAEIILFESDLSAAQKANVLNYLDTTY